MSGSQFGPARTTRRAKSRSTRNAATISPFRNNGSAIVAGPLDGQLKPDLGHETQVFLPLAVDTFTFRRAATQAATLGLFAAADPLRSRSWSAAWDDHPDRGIAAPVTANLVPGRVCQRRTSHHGTARRRSGFPYQSCRAHTRSTSSCQGLLAHHCAEGHARSPFG